MNIKCDSCTHNVVCKFRAEYENTISSIEIKIPMPFNLTISCPYFAESYNPFGCSINALSNNISIRDALEYDGPMDTLSEKITY